MNEPRRVIKLSGNFTTGIKRAELLDAVESAKAELDTYRSAGDYGSEEYFAALKAYKTAQAEFDQFNANERRNRT